jgi:HAD superfamily hydrolase (TIGR01509 family)
MLIALDCDGVLVDSEIIAAEVDARHLREFGYEISAEDVSRRFAGLTSRAIGDLIEGETGRQLPDDFFARTKEEIDRRLATDLLPIPGAREFLSDLDGDRCVCSNSSGERLRISLNHTRLMQYLEPNVFSAIEVGTKEPKPSPNVYAFAARHFRVDPRYVLVVEDSIFGVRAAKAAGARVVGFTGGRHSWPGHADLLTEAGAETVINRLADLPRIAEALMSWQGMSE